MMDSALDKRGNPMKSRSIYWDTKLLMLVKIRFYVFLMSEFNVFLLNIML